MPQVGKKALRDRANELGSRWHRDLVPKLRSGVSTEILGRYDTAFTRLIKLSGPSNLRSSYLETLNTLISPFRDELIIPAKQGSFSAPVPNAFDSFFASLGNPDESEYLGEAIACARAGYSRAAAVLGWSATIDRVHRKIEGLGFRQFTVQEVQPSSEREQHK